MAHLGKNLGRLENEFIGQIASDDLNQWVEEIRYRNSGQVHKGMVRQLLLTSFSQKGR
jgi:hypothetical protein